MKPFTRCRILANILTAVAAVLAVVLGFGLFELADNLKLVSDYTNRWLLFFIVGCALLLVLILLIIALRCIVKDAEEDIPSLPKQYEEQDNR